MSDLYSAIISASPIDNVVEISLTAVNNEDQIMQTSPAFYFSLIGSIYWELSKEHDSYGFGIMVDQYLNKEPINFEVPILEEYIQSVNDYLQGNYEGKVLKTFPNPSRINKLLSVKVKSELINNYNCVEGKIELQINSKELLEILKRVIKVGIVFDQAYF